MRIGFIGVGSIARAIVEGLCGTDDPPELLLSPRSASVAAGLAERFAAASVCASNQDVVDGAEVVFLALRTEHCAEVVAGLRFRPGQIVVNVMASIGLEQLRGMLDADATRDTPPAVVRAMPLQEVRERDCITIVYPAHPVVEGLFDVLGGSLPVGDEAAFTAFCGLTATMSAHYAYLASLAKWAVRQGIPGDDAERFLRNLFAGVGRSLREEGTTLAELQEAHETPGGANERVRQRWFEPAAPALDAVLDDLLTDLRD